MPRRVLIPDRIIMHMRKPVTIKEFPSYSVPDQEDEMIEFPFCWKEYKERERHGQGERQGERPGVGGRLLKKTGQ